MSAWRTSLPLIDSDRASWLNARYSDYTPYTWPYAFNATTTISNYNRLGYFQSDTLGWIVNENISQYNRIKRYARLWYEPIIMANTFNPLTASSVSSTSITCNNITSKYINNETFAYAQDNVEATSWDVDAYATSSTSFGDPCYLCEYINTADELEVVVVISNTADTLNFTDPGEGHRPKAGCEFIVGKGWPFTFPSPSQHTHGGNYNANLAYDIVSDKGLSEWAYGCWGRAIEMGTDVAGGILTYLLASSWLPTQIQDDFTSMLADNFIPQLAQYCPVIDATNGNNQTVLARAAYGIGLLAAYYAGYPSNKITESDFNTRIGTVRDFIEDWLSLRDNYIMAGSYHREGPHYTIYCLPALTAFVALDQFFGNNVSYASQLHNVAETFALNCIQTNSNLYYPIALADSYFQETSTDMPVELANAIAEKAEWGQSDILKYFAHEMQASYSSTEFWAVDTRVETAAISQSVLPSIYDNNIAYGQLAYRDSFDYSSGSVTLILENNNAWEADHVHDNPGHMVGYLGKERVLFDSCYAGYGGVTSDMYVNIAGITGHNSPIFGGGAKPRNSTNNEAMVTLTLDNDHELRVPTIHAGNNRSKLIENNDYYFVVDNYFRSGIRRIQHFKHKLYTLVLDYTGVPTQIESLWHGPADFADASRVSAYESGSKMFTFSSLAGITTDHNLRIAFGTGAGQTNVISSISGSTLTVAEDFAVTPGNSSYVYFEPPSVSSYITATGSVFISRCSTGPTLRVTGFASSGSVSVASLVKTGNMALGYNRGAGYWYGSILSNEAVWNLNVLQYAHSGAVIPDVNYIGLSGSKPTYINVEIGDDSLYIALPRTSVNVMNTIVTTPNRPDPLWLSETFTGPTGAPINGRLPVIGQAWAANAAWLINLNTAYNSSDNIVECYSITEPLTADYEIIAVAVCLGTPHSLHYTRIHGRGLINDWNTHTAGYFIGWDASDGSRNGDWVFGYNNPHTTSNTIFGTLADTLVINQEYTLKLTLQGTTITAIVDEALIGSVVDSTVTEKGFVGFTQYMGRGKLNIKSINVNDLS
jgi:hypothetical protein